MVFVPIGMLTDLVRRVGKSGFTELVPFIASAKVGKRVAYEKAVLIDVDIDKFIFVPSLADEGSLYRHFFLKCFEAGNLTAKYVEGLRLAIIYGPSERSLELMQSIEDCNLYAQFVVGVFSICAGRCDEGLVTLGMLYNKVNRLGDVGEVADAVMAQILLGTTMQHTAIPYSMSQSVFTLVVVCMMFALIAKRIATQIEFATYARLVNQCV